MSISIIVPVYKVEAYLHRCVESILSQTYRDLEVILVDDGSPDNCPTICDDLSKKDNRIIVIHQKNKGLAGARNAGLNIASGDFVGFVDSDDWLENDTYSYCLDLIDKYDADIVQFQLGYVYDETKHFANSGEKISVLQGKDILQNYLYSTTTGKGGDYSVCVCLFKKSLLENVRFREGKINEDIDFKYKAFSKAKVMVNSSLHKYYYFQQDKGISLGGLCRKDYDLYEASNELLKLTSNETYGRIKYYAEIKYARTPLSLLCKIAYYGISDNSINREDAIFTLTKELRGNCLKLLRSPIPFSRKVLCILFCISFRLSEKCIKLIKR